MLTPTAVRRIVYILFIVLVIDSVLFGNIIQLHSKLTSNEAVQSQGNDQVNILANCLATQVSFLDSEKCWSTFKKNAVVDVIQKIESMNTSQLIQQYGTIINHSPHKLLLPTHQCDTLKMQRFGTNAYATAPKGQHPDGAKWMCPEYLETPNCTVFSVGSEGDFKFEESIKKFYGDHCKIYTFDCTGHWLHPATEFHPWCIAGSNFEKDGRQYKTLGEIKRLLNVGEIHLFKIDVEGYEYPVLDGLEKEPPENLPKQVLMEVHFAPWFPGQELKGQQEYWVPKVLSLYKQWIRMGYQIALRELNIYSGCCAEYVLIRNP